MRIKTIIAAFTLVAAIATSNSCLPGDAGSYLRRTNFTANNHIMLVSDHPKTFGSKRLNALAVHYPDLAVFIQNKGVPGFFAETSRSGNRYLILYYLSAREAFACRSGIGNSRAVEFSGPYPITDGEVETLKKLEKTAQLLTES